MAKIKLDFGSIANGYRVVKKYGRQHLPTILTFAGLGLSIYSKYLTAKEAISANQAIKSEEERRKQAGEEDMTRKDRVKIWMQYCWLSMLAEAGGIILIGISDHIDWKLLMTMTGLYHGSKTELMEIKDKIMERDGKTALHHMEHDIRKERWHPDNIDAGGIWETGKGNTLFIDLYTGAQFHSSISYVNTAITELNTMLQETSCYDEPGYVELTDFLELLGENSRQQKCGKNVCFRYRSARDVIHQAQIVDWMDYTDPTTGEPRVAFIDYEKYLTPSDDFIERRPY